MIEACVQENGIDIPRQSLEKIIDKTFEDVDKDGDGLVSFLEYKSLAESNPGMLSHMTFNIAGIIAEYLPALRAAALSRVKN
jgi:serine/threonine-protein phosphatase 2B regulatory subunit